MRQHSLPSIYKDTPLHVHTKLQQVQSKERIILKEQRKNIYSVTAAAKEELSILWDGIGLQRPAAAEHLSALRTKLLVRNLMPPAGTQAPGGLPSLPATPTNSRVTSKSAPLTA